MALWLQNKRRNGYKNNVHIKIFMVSIQRNAAQNIIKSERECVMPTELPSQCIFKDREYKANCKRKYKFRKGKEGEKESRGRRGRTFTPSLGVRS